MNKEKKVIVSLSQKTQTQLYKVKQYLLLNNTIGPIRKIYAVFIAVSLGLLIGLIPIQAEGSNAFYAYELIFTSFEKGKIIEDKLMNLFVTYGLLALGTAIAFKAGVLNIGATGQFMTGGLLVLLLGIDQRNNFSTASAIPVMLILAASGGAVVAILAALLKTLFRINEVVSTLLLNWIVYYIFKIALFDISKYNDPNSPGTLTIGETFTFSVGNSTYLLPLIIFIFSVLVIWVILSFTTFGFKVKACGKNFNAARANGIKVNRIFISTFAISGAFCGIAGAFFYVYRSKVDLGNDLLPLEGFNAIAISLLAFNEPFGVVFTSLFFSLIETGKPAANAANINPEAITLVISIIIFFSALAVIFINARPLKWLIELIVSSQAKEIQKLQAEIDKLYDNYKNNKTRLNAIKELNEIDKKFSKMKLDVNELAKMKYKTIKLSHNEKLSQLQTNINCCYMNVDSIKSGNDHIKPLEWVNEKKIALDIHPMLRRRQELNHIIASFEIPIENKKAALKRAKKIALKKWYKSLKTPALFFMKVVA